jgi:hypothetical protein
MLLYGNGTFMQALEGEEATVDPLFAKIERDPRHANVLSIHRKTIDARQFPEWSMGFKRMSDLELSSVPGLRNFSMEDFNLEFLNAHEDVAGSIMSHYASWDPLVREVEAKSIHVKDLQKRLLRAAGGVEIAKLVLESILSAHELGKPSSDVERLCKFALSQLDQASL